jgi:Novel STAND NTPase 1
MLRQLEDYRFVAVVGSSGSGKSSLVRAGLLPAIREGFLLGCTDWLLLVIRPGREPYRHLASSLSRALASLEGDAEDRLLTRLRKSDRGLFEALGESGLSPEIRVMVVIDQFEELFAFRRATAIRGDVAARDKAAGFVSMLLRTASDSEARVWVVLTMRSEFIGDCETFLGLPEAISRSQFLVPRLDRGHMEEAIRRPGEVREAAFRPFTFEEGLVNCMINEAGDRSDQLPLLQHALMRTWKSAVERAGKEGSAVLLTNDDYRKSGGIDEALSLHADAAWKTIANDPHKASIARQLFLLLCDISPDGQIIHRRPKVAEVEAVTEAGVGEIEEVVRLFQDDDRNFLLPPREEKLSSETCLDVSHEALLRQWQLFANDWLVEERSNAEELRRLVQQASLRRKGKGGVLGPQDLERIRDWRERISPKWALRYVTEKTWDEVVAFVRESETEAEGKRLAEARQAQVRKTLLRLLGFVLVATTIVSVGFCRQAQTKAVAEERAKKNAEEALTQSFVRTIGVSDRYRLSADERAAFWELSELDIANQNVRKKVIDIWMQAADSDYMVRPLVYDSRGLHAAIGLNAMLRAAYFDSRTNETADGLAKALENPKETNSFHLSRLDDALAAFAACMNPNDAASVAHGLAKALENTQETDSYHLSSLGYALAALAARMNLNDAASVAARGASVLAEALENPKETMNLNPDGTDSGRLSRLGDALAALAARMTSQRRRQRGPWSGQGAGKRAENGLLPPVELGLRARGPRRAHEPQRRRQRGR